MQADVNISIGLQLIEFVALLLPAVAIIGQIVIRTVFRETEGVPRLAKYTFAAVLGGMSLLVIVAIDIAWSIKSAVGAEWLAIPLWGMTIGVSALGIGLVFVLASLYEAGGVGD